LHNTTKGSPPFLAILCGVVALLSACRRQERTETQTPNEKDTLALFGVEVDGKYGFINDKGSLVIPAQFDGIGSDFSEGLAAVCIGRCAFVKDGKTHPEPSGSVEEQVWQGRWGYIDKTGRFAINPQFSKARTFSHGFAAVTTGELKLFPENSHCGYIDHAGTLVITDQFSSCNSFDDAGMAAVRVGDGDDSRMGFINTTGRYLINPQKGVFT